MDKNPKDKTYEEMMREALLQIPVYSGEWTNFNGSEPGITILENLTAFQLAQREQINTVTDAIRKKLLKLAGYEPRRAGSARVLLQSKDALRSFRLPAGQKLRTGDVCFETNSAVCHEGCRIIGVYGETQEGIADLSSLLLREVPVCTALFGDSPKPGNRLYFVTTGMPQPGEEVIFYAEMEERVYRNGVTESAQNEFAQIEWEYFTGRDFAGLPCKDETAGFLCSGALRFCMPDEPPAVYGLLPAKGYVIRATLTRADYDMPVRMENLSGFLFEAWQKETKAACLQFHGSPEIDVYSSLMEEGYFRVYCREKEEEGYRLYSEAPPQSGRGRFFHMTKEEAGHYRFSFQKDKYGYGPGGLKDAVKIVVWQEGMMREYRLGSVLGYDNQAIVLPAANIMPDTFAMIARREDAQGESYYDFVKAGRREEGALVYTLSREKGELVVEDAGAFLGAGLFIASLSVSRGEAGNVRPLNEFMPEGGPAGLVFLNPCPGLGGRTEETTEELRRRFSGELYRPCVAVTARDYEELVKKTPGLCIHKVKAVSDAESNTVDIFVKPYGDRPFPELPETYRRAILRQLQEKRLLTTKIRVSGPVYLPIQVSGTVYVKARYERCQEEMEELLQRMLDYSQNDREFGAGVRFDELFDAIERLHCVEHIGGLRIRPRDGTLAVMEGQDIRPKAQCLCCPGEIALTVQVGAR